MIFAPGLAREDLLQLHILLRECTELVLVERLAAVVADHHDLRRLTLPSSAYSVISLPSQGRTRRRFGSNGSRPKMVPVDMTDLFSIVEYRQCHYDHIKNGNYTPDVTKL